MLNWKQNQKGEWITDLISIAGIGKVRGFISEPNPHGLRTGGLKFKNGDIAGQLAQFHFNPQSGELILASGYTMQAVGVGDASSISISVAIAIVSEAIANTISGDAEAPIQLERNSVALSTIAAPVAN